MAGLVNQAMGDAPAQPDNVGAGKSSLKDENLRQIDDQIQSKIPPDAKQMYNAIVAAGMRMAFDPKMRDKLMQGMQSSPDMVKNIALITTGIISMVYTESKQDINKFAKAMIPASISLMCEIMQFASDAGMIDITPETIARCSSATTDAVLKKFGIGKEQVQQVVSAGKQVATGMGA